MSNLTDSRGYKILIFLVYVELQGCVQYKSKLSDDRGFQTATLKSYIKGVGRGGSLGFEGFGCMARR